MCVRVLQCDRGALGDRKYDRPNFIGMKSTLRHFHGDRPPGGAESSDVLPIGSVAVAEMIGWPAGVAKGISKVACPEPSVVRSNDPRKTSAWTELVPAKNSKWYRVFGRLPPSQPR